MFVLFIFMNFPFFSSAPFTEWRGDALKTGAALVGRGNNSCQSSWYLWKKSEMLWVQAPSSGLWSCEAYLPAWARRLCVGRMNFPPILLHLSLSKSVFTWHFPFQCLQFSDYWLTTGAGVGGRRDAAEHLTPQHCHGCQRWHWSSHIPERCF